MIKVQVLPNWILKLIEEVVDQITVDQCAGLSQIDVYSRGFVTTHFGPSTRDVVKSRTTVSPFRLINRKSK